MKKTRKIKVTEKFFVSVTVRETGDNYNQFASVMEKGNPYPYFGTCFKDSVENKEIKSWANNLLNTMP